MEILNVAVQLSGSAVMAFHGRAVLRSAERWSRSVVVITSVDAVLVVDEQSRQGSQMTCTRWDTTMFAETETVVLICFSYFDSFTLVGDNQQRVDEELTAEDKSRRHNKMRTRFGWITEALPPNDVVAVCRKNASLVKLRAEQMNESFRTIRGRKRGRIRKWKKELERKRTTTYLNRV